MKAATAFCLDYCDQLGGYHTAECRRLRKEQAVISKSRNVSSYVKAELKARTLEAKAARARVDATMKRGRLKGAQIAEATRLLQSPPTDQPADGGSGREARTAP